MSTTFDADERSVSGSRPIDLFLITTPTQTYRLTSGPVDVVFRTVGAGHNTTVNPGLGVTYTATTMSRGDQQIAQDPAGRQIVLHLAITHPLVQRYASFGIPEREVVVSAFRYQQSSDVATQFFTGVAQTMSINGHVAEIVVPSLADDALKIKLPIVAAQRLCNHVLFDRQCTKDRVAFTDLTTLTSINGNTITLSTGDIGLRYKFGDVEHSATGERRMVIDQALNVLTLNAPFATATIGDTVKVTAGCDHTILTCRDKFANVVNFGGLPHMNLNGSFDPWAPGGLGLIVQT